jgi:hypothetical protein
VSAAGAASFNSRDQLHFHDNPGRDENLAARESPLGRSGRPHHAAVLRDRRGANGGQEEDGNFDEGQVNLVLLALSGSGCWHGWPATDGGEESLSALPWRSSSCRPLLGLLLLWGRRWRMVLGAALAGSARLVAVPQ